eukprot:Phypoly_transcript_08533.p1 GENE.Phypoly_transcript_08533~~Phypoly_transcript_08533.p1  ORF type:complete len:473 (+),score=50.52 Phypoly_transcript_08533:67-1485(+)
MLTAAPASSVQRDDVASPLTKDDVTRHFPPDFDCSQLLFSNEQIMWVQRVPKHKRYAFKQLVGILLRHVTITAIALILVIVGANLHTAIDPRVTRSVQIEYITSSVIFLILELIMIVKDFGGYGVDIATNIRILHATIYSTLVSCETISYKCIDKLHSKRNQLEFSLRVLNNEAGVLQSIKRAFSTPKFFLPYIPDENQWIRKHITDLMSNALREASNLERTEDAIQKLEDNTPSRNTEIHTKYTQLAGNDVEGDEMLWGYTPTRFERNRSTIIHVTMVLLYYLIVTVGLVFPVLSVLYEYSRQFGNTILIVWHIYFLIIIVMDTEFNEMITLNTHSIASFTTRATFFNKCPRVVQCGKRMTRLSYASAYPLYSYLYRTPNTTPVEFTFLRKLQGFEAKILGYTDGSGAIQFPNSLILRVPNMHDVECAILQKHYQMWRHAQLALPVRHNAHPSSSLSDTTENAFAIDADDV